ncbi:hypothetical protein CFELI_07800 [Corynebacterium felinum]|uniref:Uncharacterized protein n=1 Tax=Corynebacterium felinum TaxID=131318 RepID=A0ABU2BA55_9CORY|nr:hypothetical protein [Corynebacterium felinum]MDR7355434.1 hypothetical protein [Corynebacterium felinum]MDR7355501.1 hypothetical protein [Corynebacterium felinum]MDR7355705.1 hypothetical protein [Corynebacterium felinum]MDR7355828.1 hypothetical protein [Corynebacterium felinum]
MGRKLQAKSCTEVYESHIRRADLGKAAEEVEARSIEVVSA